jgi:hypothetical protein
MAIGDECTLKIIGRYQSQNVVNTMHYRIMAQTTGDPEILTQLCVGWHTDIESAWLACHHTDYELVGLKAFGKTGTAKTPGIVARGNDGTRSGTGAPSFACRTVTLYTADAKHRRRGRVMLSGSITEDFDTSDGSLTAGAKTPLDTLGALLVAAITVNSDEFEPGIPAVGEDSWQDFTDFLTRETPSCVTSRRVREFFVG